MTEPAERSAQPPVTVSRAEKGLSTTFVSPRTALERQLAGLWSERLGVFPVGVDDDFFELGGHSLAAAELLVDIEEMTGMEVAASTLFLQPSVAELAAAIEALAEAHR